MTKRLTPEQAMYNKHFRAKVKVFYICPQFRKCELKDEAGVWKKTDALPIASELIAIIIKRIANRDHELGFSEYFPIPHIKEIAWTTYNTAGTIISNGRTVWLSPKHDPPVSIQTQLSFCVDKALRYYQQQKGIHNL